MPSIPTSIYGTIKFRNATDTIDFPRFGITGSNPLKWLSSGDAQELYIKSSYFIQGSSRGLTADNLPYIYLNNSFDFAGLPYLTNPIAGGFSPSFYIGSDNEPKIAWNYTTTGSVNFASAPNNGTTGDRFEVFYLRYTTSSFLTAAGGGASANAITGITFAHEILPGNTTLSAQQIYYRRLGNVNTVP